MVYNRFIFTGILLFLLAMILSPFFIIVFMSQSTAQNIIIFGVASLFLIVPLTVACTHHP
jgi:hypothetical protein